MNELNQFNNQLSRIMNNLAGLTLESAEIAVDYFKDSFNTKSFDNVKWKDSLDNPDTLVQSGALQDSIRITDVDKLSVLISSDKVYSKIHNEGGKILITEKMRSFFWHKYNQTKKSFWKALATTKKIYIEIPKRQFMGDSVELEKKISEHIHNRVLLNLV